MDIPKRLGIQDSDFRLVLGGSSISYDPAKNDANVVKHGYSFDDAKKIFERLVFPFGGKSVPWVIKNSIPINNEMRSNILTKDENGHIVLIALTMRPDETVRIISMRRASKAERAIFSNRYKLL